MGTENNFLNKFSINLSTTCHFQIMVFSHLKHFKLVYGLEKFAFNINREIMRLTTNLLKASKCLV